MNWKISVYIEEEIYITENGIVDFYNIEIKVIDYMGLWRIRTKCDGRNEISEDYFYYSGTMNICFM
jgi:hypothetical protein